MQTNLPAAVLADPLGERAEAILRSCVHCGFCNAVCPTYALLGDELDGPRGRIYLIKELLSAEPPGAEAPATEQQRLTATHLDRCLTCRACETSCPSGVAYHELLEYGRAQVAQVPRDDPHYRWRKQLLLTLVPYPARLRPLLRLGRWLRPLLGWLRWPAGGLTLAAQIPAAPMRDRGSKRHVPGAGLQAEPRLDAASSGAVLLLQGCVQRLTTPDTNSALRQLLQRLGVQVYTAAAEGCCGSLHLHLGEQAQALQLMRDNLRALAPYLSKVDAVISTASGCGPGLQDYGRLLATDAEYAELAAAFSAKVQDAAVYLAALDVPLLQKRPWRRVAWMPPCSLQHGLHGDGEVVQLLQAAGYELVPMSGSDYCCGAAGNYMLTQPALAATLRERKLAQLERLQPEVIVTANVGCQLHLAPAAAVPVVHYLELLG